jgi:hypothetical protein
MLRIRLDLTPSTDQAERTGKISEFDAAIAVSRPSVNRNIENHNFLKNGIRASLNHDLSRSPALPLAPAAPASGHIDENSLSCPITH